MFTIQTDYIQMKLQITLISQSILTLMKYIMYINLCMFLFHLDARGADKT